MIPIGSQDVNMSTRYRARAINKEAEERKEWGGEGTRAGRDVGGGGEQTESTL